jgi:polysaccharide biosynthesis transport protein
MNITQFLRILWARRWFIVAAPICCLVGALVVVLIFPPQWQAHSRVMLNLLKPDPVTGEVIAGPTARAYVATQTELITDYSVAGQVADQLGWLSDPNLIQRYQRRPASDVSDFRHWLAQRVIEGTKAQVLQNSNILEITYTANTPSDAKAVADALRTAYITTSLNFRRDDATRNADWYDAEAQKAKAALDAASAAETDYERTNGIVMADDKTDLETARLRALSAEGVSTGGAPVPATASPASIQLAQLDAQIAQASKTLGPNHPELQQLRAQRASVAALAAQDQAAARSAMAAASASNASAVNSAVAAQKSRVIAQGDKLEKLSQLQSEVDLRRDLFQKTSARAAELRQEAAAADTGLVPLGPAVTPKDPTFPNMLLIIPGSLALGLGVGVLVALLAELFGRRVRGMEDLQFGIGAPLLGVISAPAKSKPGIWRRASWLIRPKWPNNDKMARAA